MRIALVANNVHFRGGMERYCAEIVRGLASRHEFHLFSTEVDDVPMDRVTVHPIPAIRKPILLYFLQFYRQASRMVRPEDFDVVHSIGGITARQTMVTAQYCQYAWGDVLKREPAAGEGLTPYHHFMWRLWGHYEKRAVRHSETRLISANSERTSCDLQAFYGCPPERIRVIYNGVDPERFSPEKRRGREAVRAKFGIDEKALLILFVGEYQRKGLAYLVRALGHLPTTLPYRLLAVGRGDIPRYQKIAEEAGVADRVVFSPPQRQIEDVFGAADLFVFPTFYEPFGNVITEAMASGLPVVTTRRAGAAEVITPGESGVLIEQPSDVRVLAEAIQPLLEDTALREQIGTAARATAAQYTWSRVARETEELYLSLC